MTQPTLTTESSRTYLVLRAAIVHDDPGCPGAWRAEVADAASPLAGLYAFGDSLVAARDALAVTAWAAVVAGELAPFGLGADVLAGIHVVVSTCATYGAEWLTSAIDAA
jgi:hypothetical protein